MRFRMNDFADYELHDGLLQMIGDKRGPRAHKEHETSPPRQSWPSFDLALELSQDWWRKRTKQPGDEQQALK